jgi:hypothetical protein
LFPTFPSGGFMITVPSGSVATAGTFPSGGYVYATYTGNTRPLHSVQVNNTSAFEVEVNCSQGAPPKTTLAFDSFYVPGNSTISAPDNVHLGDRCFMRSFSGNISTGTIYLFGWE